MYIVPFFDLKYDCKYINIPYSNILENCQSNGISNGYF